MHRLVRSFSASDMASLHVKEVSVPPSATVASNNTVLSERCSVCLLKKEKPVTLACSHSFCSNCLETAASTPSLESRCPLCRRETILDPSRVSMTDPFEAAHRASPDATSALAPRSFETWLSTFVPDTRRGGKEVLRAPRARPQL